MSKSLYFLAILLQGDRADELTKLKRSLSEKYASFHALRTPVHITLLPPTAIEDDRQGALLDALAPLSSGFEPGDVHLGAISSFPPRVIFIEVINDPYINLIHSLLMALISEAGFGDPGAVVHAFHPHVTLMTRDLKRSAYHEAMADLSGRRFDWKFRVERLHLLRHNGKKWQVIKEYKSKNQGNSGRVPGFGSERGN